MPGGGAGAGPAGRVRRGEGAGAVRAPQRPPGPVPGGAAHAHPGARAEPRAPSGAPPHPPAPRRGPPQPSAEATAAPAPQGPEDGNYTANVTLSGGTGRASIQSPAKLRCTNGQFTATIQWSSPNFDYMKVNGTRYDLISAPGADSAFEIPVAAFDTPLPVIADTIAMSEPHEVEYAITFDSASLTKQ